MSLTGKKIFVTGGAGFIGTTLCARLVEDNEIVIFDNEHRNALRYTELRNHPNVRFIHGDVMDYPAVLDGMKGCQIVVHLAAIAGVDDVFNHPVLTMKVNMLGTYHVLEAAMQHGGIERLIDFSTSEVFGSYAFRVQEGDVRVLPYLARDDCERERRQQRDNDPARSRRALHWSTDGSRTSTVDQGSPHENTCTSL